jgi:hypothetical protein
MLSDLAILTEEAAKNEEFSTENVRIFLATRVAAREGARLTKADVSVARTNFLGEKPKTGPRLKRKTGHVSDGSEPAGKRVRMGHNNSAKISQAPDAPVARIPATLHHVGPSQVVWQFSYLTKPQYDNNAHLHGAATNFRQHLLSHVQEVNRQRVEKRNEFNQLQNSFEEQLIPYQPLLHLRSVARDAVKSSEEKLEHLNADSERLASFRFLLDDFVDQSMDAPSEPAVAHQRELWDQTAANELREQTAANVREVNEAEAELESARLDLEERETALGPFFLTYEKATKDRLDQLMAESNKLTDQTKHADFMRVVVENGPSAFATIEKALAAKNISLGDIVAQIPAATINSVNPPAGFE